MRKYSRLLRKTSNNIFALTIIPALLLSLLLLLCGCSYGSGIREVASEADSLPQPDPRDSFSYTQSVKLYYRFSDSAYLIPVTESIEILSNETPESAVIRALLSGMGAENIYSNAIPSSVEAKSVVVSGNVIYLTLSEEFIKPDKYGSSSEIRIAVYEIINTLTEFRDMPVQLLVDRTGNGSGERVSYTELGFSNSDSPTGAFLFTSHVIAPPDVIFSHCMKYLAAGNFRAASYLFSDSAKGRKIIETELGDVMGRIKLISFSEPELITDGDTQYVCSDLVLGSTDNEKEEFLMRVISNDGLYQISFSDFINALEGYAA